MDPFEVTELAEGTRLLDRYTIIDKIAGGGMASIYRAMDDRLDRVVCVKLLRLVLEAGSTGGSSVYQATYSHFQKEALALSKLQHPNTLKIYDFGHLEESGRPFQISEFLDAGTLEQHVRTRGGLPPDEVVGILDPIAGAIEEAHAHSIIHRDIKPSNILFARVGNTLVPKLADFGIAHSNLRKRGDNEDEPISVVSLFSPRWAAPEQLAGDPASNATDVYGLALVTAFMLSGTSIFDSKDVRVTFPERIGGDALVRRRLDEVGIDRAVQPALLRALSAPPESRTQSVQQLFSELRQALGNVPQPSERAPASTQARVGGRAVRIIEVDERLDLSFPGEIGIDVRVRVTIVPSLSGYALNVKGLNCFVTKEGRPAAAIVATQDGTADLVSTTRERMGQIAWSFGMLEARGRVFRVEKEELVVPASQTSQSVALTIESTGEVLVMVQRSR